MGRTREFNRIVYSLTTAMKNWGGGEMNIKGECVRMRALAHIHAHARTGLQREDECPPMWKLRHSLLWPIIVKINHKLLRLRL